MIFLVVLLVLLIDKLTDWRRDVQQMVPGCNGCGASSSARAPAFRGWGWR